MENSLRQYQRWGVRIAKQKKKLIIGDEMGLGKTAQAVVATDDMKTTLVICPASLKINWQREFEKWSPARKVEMISGRKPYPLKKANVYIINYDLIYYWRNKLRYPNALIFDESHYLKSFKSKRTLAGLELCKSKPKMVILLSGTPMIKTPFDLLPQLTAIDMLDRFGGAMQYVDRYCPPFKKRIRVRGGRFRDIIQHGAKNLEELNKILIENQILLRRTKADVLGELPPKTYADLFIDANLHEYKSIEQEDIPIGLKINKLRHESGRAKVDPVLNWLKTFDDPIILWVHHRDVGEALRRRLGCPGIYGGMTAKARQTAIDEFQAGKHTRIVCSIQAAGVGLTLTAASNALFVEQPWNSTDMAQAEDRCHRIGQKDNVTIWQAKIPKTIDEYVYKVIRRKAATIDQVIDGIAQMLER